MKHKFLKNASFYFSAKIVSFICSFFAAVLMGRYLGVSHYGIYSFAIAIGNILVVFLNMGARNFITREIIHQSRFIDRFLGNIFLIRFILVLLMEAGLFIYLQLSRFDTLTNIVVVVVVNTVFLNSFLMIYFALYRAKEVYTIEILNEIIISALTVLGYFVILRSGYRIKTLVLFLLSLSFVQNLILGYRSARLMNISWTGSLRRANLKDAVKVFYDTLPFFLTSVFSVIYFRIATIMLRMYCSSWEVGLYSSAYKFLEMSSYLPDTIVYILFPILIKQSLKNHKNLVFYYQKVFKFFLLIVIPLALILNIYSGDVIRLIWGPQFFSAGRPLRVLAFAIIFLFFNYIMGNIIVALKQEKYLTLNTFITALVNIAANLYFIPRYKELGAAWTTIISEGLFCVLNYIVISRTLTRQAMPLPVFSRIIGVNILFIVFIRFVSIPSLFVGPLVYLAFYTGLVLLFRVLDESDYRLISVNRS
ncbi:MAG: flippase [bacterium]|nr:flippase [bacterium]